MEVGQTIIFLLEMGMYVCWTILSLGLYNICTSPGSYDRVLISMPNYLRRLFKMQELSEHERELLELNIELNIELIIELIIEMIAILMISGIVIAILMIEKYL